MTITIANHQKAIRINRVHYLKAARKILNLKGIRRVNLVVIFVTDQKIKALNKKFLNKEHVTDVLSFDSGPNVKSPKEINAEIVISAARAVHNARLYGSPVQTEIVLYLVHGILHLLGYDDHDAQDTRRMRREEKRILRAIGYDR